jgi:polysaccharide chain length determinant protein (PEP-CTERM system associated)
MQSWKMQLRAYLSGAWHYRWVAMGVTWAVCLSGWLILAFVPNQFQANATIYVDTDTMMAPLLQGLTVSTDPQQQVSLMLNTLLTRPNLEQVVHQTDPRGLTISNADLAREVQRIRSDITLVPMTTRNLFQITYDDKDPNTALAVSQTLLSILVESNVGGKRRDLEGAQSFLDEKVGEYENLLRQAEQRRAAFRQANLDVLVNPLTPEVAATKVEEARQQLGQAQARLSSLRTQLAGIPKVLYIDGPGPLILSGAGGATSAMGGSGGSLFQQLADAKQNLIELQSRFTDDHPDVKAAKRRVAQLQAELSAVPTGPAQQTGNQSVPNPVYTQTQSKLSDALTDVAFRSHNLAEAQSNLDRSKHMTNHAIDINTKFADLDRDYELLHKTYQELISRRESARLSQSVNDEQSAVNVRVVEPPKKAPFPVAPNRPLLNSLILVIGIAIGVATAVGLSINAGRFFSRDQLSAELDYQIIGVVARLSRADAALQSRRAYTALATGFALLLISYIGVSVALDANFRGILLELL